MSRQILSRQHLILAKILGRISYENCVEKCANDESYLPDLESAKIIVEHALDPTKKSIFSNADTDVSLQ